MWCAKCQTEVAVEARPNSQRLQCATCGSEILPKMSGRSSPMPPANQPPADRPGDPANVVPGAQPPIPGKNPHDLLARWAGNQMFDPFGPLVPPEPRKEPPRAPHIEPPKPKSEARPPQNPDQAPRYRVDPAFTQGWSDIPAPHVSTPLPLQGSRSSKLVDREMPPGYVAHAPAQLRGPHFDPARMRQPIKKSGWIAWFGQTLAYIGAATLTVGAGMVLVGYLGGPTHYAPTGWFTTTVGQMLLFLGVVTLVSAGMEQTTVEVAYRIDTLGEQLDRMEYHSQSNAQATEAEVEAELRAEIAHLRQQLSEQGRG
ncbi:MAG: hypothetical protein JWN70_6435 [Planctomycetaceae bacterium]|nr:hypothetical protein [Planctomycetaceae bacterium]